MSIKNKILSKLNALIRRSYWFNNVAFPDCKKFWTQKTFNLDLVNIGSSSGKYAFNYTGLNIKAANWAVAPQSFVGDTEVLRNYFSFLKSNGGVVFIPLCPFSALGGSSDYFHDKYYSILDLSSIPHASCKKKQEVMNIFQHPLNYYPLFELFRDLSRIFRKQNIIMDEKTMEVNANNMIQSWMKEFSITDFNDPLSLVNQDAKEDGAKILSDLIQFCVDRNLKPVLIIPPMTKYLSSKLTPQMRENFINSFVEKANSQNAIFLSYLDNDDFIDNSLYRNSFLLNEKGARKFTSQVLHDIGLLKS
jgi:hypothetical protein